MNSQTALKNNSRIEVVEHFNDKFWRLNNLYHIINEHGKKVKFRCNLLQEKFYNDLWYLNVLLKARQFGGTTVTDIYFLDDCLFIRNLEAGIIAHNREDAQKIFRRKIKFPYDNLPEGLKNQRYLITDSRQELAFNNGSVIYVATSVRSGTVQRLHICLAGDTEVMLKDGFTKEIKNVMAGDLVLTSRGSYQKVERLIQNKLSDIKEPLYAVHSFGYYKPLKLTGNHKILTRQHKTGAPEWKKTCDLVSGDYIAYPTREASLKSRDGLIPFGQQKCNKEGAKRVKNSGSRVGPDFNLGWLAGFYLAEGTIRRINGNPPTRVTFSIHEKETDTLIKRIEALGLVNKSKGRLISVREAPGESKTVMVDVNSKDFAWFIAERFGDSKHKYMPDSVWNLGQRFIRGLIKGYFDGDGSYSDTAEIQVTSIRRQLIDQLRLLLISMRYGYPRIYHREAGSYYGRNCQEAWVLKLYGAGNWKFRKEHGLVLPDVHTWTGNWRIGHGRNPEGRKLWRRGKDHYWARIKKIEQIPDEKYVYDIVLKNDPHDYVTVNGVVSNSELARICRKYPDKAEEIKTGSLNAIHPGNIVVIESTAQGRHGDFFNFCQTARKSQQAGKELTKMDYKFHFYPWFWDAKNSLDISNVIITPDMQEYFAKLEAKEKGPAGEQLKLTDGQKAWYTKKAAVMVDKMYEEFPSTPDEAFAATIQGAYYSTQMTGLRKRKQLTIVPYEPSLPVNTAWDLGIDDEAVLIFHQRHRLENRIIDYYANNDEALSHYVGVMRRKGYVYGTHYLPHDIAVKSLSTGKTRLETLQKLMPGEKIVVVEKLGLADGIESCRNFLPTCWIDEVKCAPLIDALDAYQREPDDKHGGFKDRPLHNWASHPADAMRYLSIGFNPETSNKGRWKRRRRNAMSV